MLEISFLLVTITVPTTKSLRFFIGFLEFLVKKSIKKLKDLVVGKKLRQNFACKLLGWYIIVTINVKIIIEKIVLDMLQKKFCNKCDQYYRYLKQNKMNIFYLYFLFSVIFHDVDGMQNCYAWNNSACSKCLYLKVLINYNYTPPV